VPTSSTQATHLRFSFLFVNSFTTSEPHRDNPSLVFRNSYNLRDPRSLNQSLCIRRKKKRNSLLKRRILQLKFMDELLMDLQVFAQEFLLKEHLAMKFSWNISHWFLKSDTHIYRPFVPFQNGLKRCVFSKSFSEVFSLVIDYRFLVIDYTVIFWRVMTFEFEFSEFRCW